MEVAIQVVAQGRVGQDCAAAFEWPDGRQLLVVADGAGGSSGGAEAAQAVIDCVRVLHAQGAPVDWARVLTALDLEIARMPQAGETTAVVALIQDGMVRGASVGDSGAWVVRGQDVSDLTEHQHRKPLLGSGVASPVSFGPVDCGAYVLLASDGLFKYAPPRRIAELVRSLPPAAAAHALVDAARLPSGRLQDDVAVALIHLPHRPGPPTP